MNTPDDPKRDSNDGKVVDLSNSAKRKKAKSRLLKAKGKAKTLCASGFHRWQIDQRKQFDVKAGKLIRIERCSRCGQTKTRAT